MANPNTQPIFIRTPIYWTTNLTNETVPGRLVGSAVPKFLGTAGEAGTLIESLFAAPSGDIPAVIVRFFAKFPDTQEFVTCAEVTLAELTGSNPATLTDRVASLALPKLLSPASCDGTNPHQGLRLPPGTSLYAGLSQTVSNAIIVSVLGGDY